MDKKIKEKQGLQELMQVETEVRGRKGLRSWKPIKWLLNKPIRWIALVAILALASFLVFNTLRAQNAAQQAYQTVKLERGDLVAIVGATGLVEANQTAELNWQTTGRVESIIVKVNDEVKAGDILADLVDNTLPQSVILAQADLVAAQKELEDLINSNTQSSQAYADLLQAERELRTAKENRDDWNYNNANIKRVNDARADFIDKEEELKIVRSAYEALSDLPADNPDRVKAKQAYDETKLIRDKALRTLNYILGKAFGQQVAEDFADYDLAVSMLADAQREWDRVKNGANAGDISAAEAKVAAAEATVSLGWIIAPFDGTVTQAFPKVGDQVDSGDAGFRVDDLSRMFVDVHISEVDINRVVVRQRADLTFDAISNQTYSGEVTEVAKVGQDSGSGVEFMVTLKIVDPDDQVRPGMTAAVNLIVREIKDVLILPSRVVRGSNGKRVVYRLNGGQLEEVVVEIGSSSDTHVEIVSGDVKEGDLIVLNPPFELVPGSGRPAFTR